MRKPLLRQHSSLAEAPLLGGVELDHHHHVIRVNIQRQLQLFTKPAAEVLLLRRRTGLSRQNMKLNKVIAAPAAFIVPVEQVARGRDLLKNLEAIPRRNREFCLQALLEDVRDLRYPCVAVSRTQGNTGEGHRDHSSSRQPRAETAAGQPA